MKIRSFLTRMHCFLLKTKEISVSNKQLEVEIFDIWQPAVNNFSFYVAPTTAILMWVGLTRNSNIIQIFKFIINLKFYLRKYNHFKKNKV